MGHTNKTEWECDRCGTITTTPMGAQPENPTWSRLIMFANPKANPLEAKTAVDKTLCDNCGVDVIEWLMKETDAGQDGHTACA